MKHFLPFVLFFFAACSVAPPPAPTGAGIIEALKAQLPSGGGAGVLGALAEAVPLPAQTLVESELSVVVVGHLGAVQVRDRSWIVQVGTNTRLLGYASSAGGVGAALNLPGSNGADVLTMQVATPRQVVAGDALVVVSASAGGFSTTDEAMAVVFVPYPIHAGLLRPPAIGNDPVSRFLRTWAPIPEDLVDMARAPGVIDFGLIYAPGGPVNPAAWGAAPPTLASVLTSVGRFAGETTDGWGVHYSTPSRQLPEAYGTFYSGALSTALVYMLSTKPMQERRQVALAIVQRGLDQIGATCSGRVLYPLGGHCMGRKALVVVTGHLLNVEVFADPSASMPMVFAEDHYRNVSSGAWWFGGGWTATWPFSRTAPWAGERLRDHPSTWGMRDAPNHDTWNWTFAYIGQVVPAQVGTSLAMVLLGRERELGPVVQMARQWMAGPPAAALAELQAAGHALPWGQDYAVPAGLCATAWRRYAGAGL